MRQLCCRKPLTLVPRPSERQGSFTRAAWREEGRPLGEDEAREEVLSSGAHSTALPHLTPVVSPLLQVDFAQVAVLKGPGSMR